ncbi:hypothetical protein HRG_013218 [Hirsutella rhossiliensis]
MIPWMSRSSSKKQAPGSPASRHISTVEISCEAYAYFAHDEDSCHRRATVQHFVLFVPWESFMCEEMGDINSIWARARDAGSENIMSRRHRADIVRLVRRSAEDAKRDAKQWASSSGDAYPTVAHVEGRDGRGGRRINSDVSVQTASETQRS